MKSNSLNENGQVETTKTLKLDKLNEVRQQIAHSTQQTADSGRRTADSRQQAEDSR
jgi:hypothetical protein